MGLQLAKDRFEWSPTESPEEWDDFVVQNRGSVFHLWSWRKVLEFRQARPLYLACRDRQGRILAVCPFFYKNGRYLRYLDSLPYSLMAGPLVSKIADVPSAIVALRNSVGFSPFNPVIAMRIKVHQESIIKPLMALGMRHSLGHGLFILDFDGRSPEHIWNHGFQRHDRRAVKYLEDHGASFCFASKENDFSSYLSLERGAKWYTGDGADFLARMRKYLGDTLLLASATFENKMMSGVPLICDSASSTVHLGTMRYASMRNIHEPMANVTYINWKIANWAFEHGFRRINFGSYPIAESSNPEHPYCQLRQRFGITLVPRYQFILPTSSFSYAVAKTMSRMV
jgi:hypothetical protein